MIKGWQTQFILSAWKATLIRPVWQYAYIYTMSTFKVPITIYKQAIYL